MCLNESSAFLKRSNMWESSTCQIYSVSISKLAQLAKQLEMSL